MVTNSISQRKDISAGLSPVLIRFAMATSDAQGSCMRCECISYSVETLSKPHKPELDLTCQCDPAFCRKRGQKGVATKGLIVSIVIT